MGSQVCCIDPDPNDRHRYVELLPAPTTARHQAVPPYLLHFQPLLSHLCHPHCHSLLLLRSFPPCPPD